MKHCTLTVGDTLQVEHAGTQYTLRVNQLKPAPAVSVIDTDVEAEVVASGGIIIIINAVIIINVIVVVVVVMLLSLLIINISFSIVSFII